MGQCSNTLATLITNNNLTRHENQQDLGPWGVLYSIWINDEGQVVASGQSTNYSFLECDIVEQLEGEGYE